MPQIVPIGGVMPQGVSSGPSLGSPAPPSVALDRRGVPIVSSDTSDRPDEKPSELRAMLESFAHPQTFTDFANLLTVGGVDTVRKAATSALAMQLARGPVGGAFTAVGRAAERTGAVLTQPAKYVGLWELFTEPKKAAMMLAGPGALRATGRVLQKMGSALSGEASPLSVTEEGELIKQGYSPAMVAKVKDALKAASTPQFQPRSLGNVSAPLSPVESSFAAPPAAAGPAAGEPMATTLPSPVTNTVPPAVASKPHLTLEEFRAAQELIKEGYDRADVLKAIERNRLPKAWLNLPSDAEVQAAVADRNATGRWPQDRQWPQTR